MIELARELGLALANSAEFINMKQAQAAFESNEAVSELMRELEEKSVRLIQVSSEDEIDNIEAVSLTDDIDRLKAQIRECPLYEQLVSAQNAFSIVLNAVNEEINACIGGESASGCEGDCSACGSCRH